MVGKSSSYCQDHSVNWLISAPTHTLLIKFTYDKNVISKWLDSWLNHEASLVDVLTWFWRHGEAKPGSDWIRDKELSE